MKILQTVQKKYAILGICSNQSKCNRKSVLMCLIYSLGCTLSALFLFYEANSFQEYTNNIYITSALAMCVTFFAIVVVKMRKLFEMIDNMEKSIDESKCVS